MNQVKLVFLGLVAAVALALVFLPWYDNSMLGVVVAPFMPADWDNISERYIVKNAVLLSLVGEVGDKCIMHSEKLTGMFDHEYFISSMEVKKQLQYDEEAQTIVAPCENIQDEQLRLHLRYVTQEAPKDGTKYEYTFTEPNILMAQPERNKSVNVSEKLLITPVNATDQYP